MLTAEVKVNGVPLGTLYALRKGSARTTGNVYEYEYYEIGSGRLVKGSVWHIYSDGHVVLVQKLFEAVHLDSSAADVPAEALESTGHRSITQ